MSTFIFLCCTLGLFFSLRKIMQKKQQGLERFHNYDFSDEFKKSETHQRRNFLTPINTIDSNIEDDGTVRIIKHNNDNESHN